MSARRTMLAVTAFACLTATTAAGCGSSASNAASQASSAASQAASKAGDAASSAASQAAASASSAAASAMAAAKGAFDATSDVKAGEVSTDSDGRTSSELTVTNPTSDPHDYTISVSFTDDSDKLLDATVVTVSGVAANGSATATARSNRTLTGATTVKVTGAVRH
jgi:hypothetical protein